MTHKLSADNLTLIRGERCLFQGLSFALESGGLLLLEGRGRIVASASLGASIIPDRPNEAQSIQCEMAVAAARDALAMAHEDRFEQYDVMIDRPRPLVPRCRRLPVSERMDHKGDVLMPLDESSVQAAIPILDRHEVESVAIGYLHAFVNPEHEQRTAEEHGHEAQCGGHEGAFAGRRRLPCGFDGRPQGQLDRPAVREL